MLNIPESIKTLFKTDGVFKNFRVHFPNGEHADLTNSDIVSESVKFTESICSKEVFQFGLSERSQIEFECVNMPNIYGVTIECGIEIDTSSLSASEIADIQSGTYDGELVLQADSDIGFGYYHIPYGVFVVHSCPRSHGAMYRRRVTAYGKAPQDITLSSFLSRKFSMQYNLPQEITQNPFALIADAQNSIDFLNTTETTLTTNTTSRGFGITLSNGNYLNITVSYANTTANQYDPATLYRITADIDLTFMNTVIADLEERGVSFEKRNDDPDVMFNSAFFPFVLYTFSNGAGWGYTRTILPGKNVADYDSGYIYPYMPLDQATGTMRICYPVGITKCRLLRAQGSSTVIHDYGTSSGAVANPVIKSYTISDTSIAKASISINGTGVGTISGVTVYSYLNSLDLSGLYNGIYELMGCFRRIGRDGQEKTVTLSKDTPYAISPEQYSELWWDDFTVDIIGTILLQYKDADAGENQTIKYEIGSGSSVYEMTDNYFLNNLSVTSADLGETIEEYVLGMIDTYFVPNIGAVNFLPYEMTALNIPYFEPGDYVQIDNGDNGTVDTFILSRNISGIQTLYDDSEASSGKLDGEG